MATLVESFICQHFDNIYKEICHGTKGQTDCRKISDKKNCIATWDFHVSKNSVLESIRQFFHLCLNASVIDSESQKVQRWTNELLTAACLPPDNRYIDADRYGALVQASDPFTKFLFGCFDWQITDINPKDNYGDRYICKYDSRTWYYSDCVRRGNKDLRFTANLLYDYLKELRNQESHTTVEEFFAMHPKCMQRLVYILYDYITVFYMITHVCIDNDGCEVRILDDVRSKTKMPSDFLSTQLVVKCVDESNGEYIQDREKDVRLYRLEKNGTKTAVNVVNSCPGKFKVPYFCEYIISIVTDGEESLPSEKFGVDYDFIEGTIVKINVPPKGSPKPIKVSIRELVFGTDDLSADANWILDTIEQYAGKSEFAEVARLLVMASVTKTEFSKKAYQAALEQLKASLQQKAKAELPDNFDDFMKAEVHKFQERFSESFKPYRGKEDFFELLECIDSLYDMFSYSGYDANTPHIIQILNNADQIDKETKFTNATSSSDESTHQQKRLQKLKFLFSMHEKYPEIVESEISHLGEKIEDLYINQINYYMDYTNPLRNRVRELLDYTKSNVEHSKDGQKVLKYANLLNTFLNDTPDNVIRIVQHASTLLLYWIDQCGSADEEIVRLKQHCSDLIKELRDNRDLQVPMIPISNDDKTKVEKAYRIIRQCIDELTGRVALLGLPVSDSELLSEVRFTSLVQLITSCSPKSLMQFVCCSLNVKSEMEWLLTCRSLGISCVGLTDSTPYNEWERVNKILLNSCSKVINILWWHFSGRERQRTGDTHYSTEVEVSNAEASLIVEYQQKQIRKIYGDNIPDFYRDIINVSNYVLPSHAKAMLLREATVVHSCQTESLLYVINAVLRYWGYSGHLARLLLDKYIIREYAKKLVAQESLDDFKLMPHASQRLYLEVLMEDKHNLACLLPSTRYMIAYRLNYAKGENGNEVIDNREFFMKLSQISSFEISPYRYDEFVDLSNIVSLVAQYSNQHPDDKVIDTLSKAQAIKYLTACYDYFDKHLNVCPIEEGSCKPGLLRKVYLRQELKGKTPDEQMVIRYLDLYDGLEYHMNDNGKFKSEWCEKEEQLFHEIISTLTDKNPKAQQRISSTLWSVIHMGYWGERMPFDDIKAERLMALKPFFSQDDYVETINSYYKECSYVKAKTTISNPSVLVGLNKIRTLFEQSKDNIKVSFDGQPTAFIDIIIAIYKMKEEIKNWKNE